MHLADGSRLVHEIQQLTPEGLKLATKFAGELMLPVKQVVGLTADRKLTIALASGDTVVGEARFVPGQARAAEVAAIRTENE